MGGSEILPAAPVGAAEGTLIDQSLWGGIRASFERGWSKRAIAREFGVDIKTVRKWLRRHWERQRRRRVRGLDAHREFLVARAPEVGFNGSVLLRELRGRGYQGCYSVLSEYIAPWRAAWRGEPEATLRFETGPGEQSQADWGSTEVYLGEERVRVHVFTMVLGFSRRIFARAYRHERLEALLDAHERAFAHFGGRTEAILYDNPRTIVTEKNEETGEVVWNRTFADRMDFYGVKVKLCRYYRAQTKGKVENGVGYVKGNALAGRRFRDLEDLNAYLLDWCVNVADQRVHGTTHEKPAERFARGEVLIPVDLRPVPPRERVVVRIVPRDALVAVEANRYPVPFGWVGRKVEVRMLVEQIVIHGEGGEEVKHPRLSGKHQVARWEGPARGIDRRVRPAAPAAPRFDPMFLQSLGEVSPRPLLEYEEIAAAGGGR